MRRSAVVAIALVLTAGCVLVIVMKNKERFVAAVDDPARRPYFAVGYTPPSRTTLVAIDDDARIPECVYEAWRDTIPGIRFAGRGDDVHVSTSDLVTVNARSPGACLCAFHDAYKFLIIVTPGRGRHMTLAEFATDYSRILCPSNVVRDIVRCLFAACGLPPPRTRVAADSRTIDVAGRGAVAVWTCDRSALMSHLSTRPIGVLTYDDAVDANKLRVLAPFVYLKNIDIIDMLPRTKLPHNVRVVSAVCSPIVAVVADDPDPPVDRLALRLAKECAGREWPEFVGVNNAFEMRGMRLLRSSMQLFRGWNAEIGEVRETFEYVIRPSNNVRGTVRYLDERREITLKDGPRIEDFVLRRGDRVELAHQDNAEENGTYFVVSERTDVLSTHVPLRAVDAIMTMDDGKDDGAARYLVTKSTTIELRVGDKVRMSGRNGVVEKTHRGGSVIVRLDDDDEDADAERFHPLARCTLDPSITVREMCEAIGGVWDRPCERHMDCPFFRDDDRGRRGTCDAGFCEMPIGVKRVGFRHFEGTPMPMTDFPLDEFGKK